MNSAWHVTHIFLDHAVYSTPPKALRFHWLEKTAWNIHLMTVWRLSVKLCWDFSHSEKHNHKRESIYRLRALTTFPPTPTKRSAPTNLVKASQTLWEVCAPAQYSGASEERSNGTRFVHAAASAAQVIQRGSRAAVYTSKYFCLKLSVGPKASHSYSTATKLRGIEYTGLPYYDDDFAQNRGTATWHETGLGPK